MTAQLFDKPPIASRLASERALGHFVGREEAGDLAQDRMMFHEQDLLRVITRMSSAWTGIYTILRSERGGPISWAMGKPQIDMEKLEADLAAKASATSDRSLSLAVTGGTNESWYRNWKGGQNKRLSAEVFLGIAAALERDPCDYVKDFDAAIRLPNEVVLTNTFASLLATLEIDPFVDGRAQMLARRFPNALRQMTATHAGLAVDEMPSHEAASRDPSEDRLTR